MLSDHYHILSPSHLLCESEMKNQSVILPLCVLSVCIASVGYFAYDQHPKDRAQVAGVHWVTITNTYEKATRRHANWFSAPKRAYNVKCERKQHGWQYCFCGDAKDYSDCSKCPVRDMFCEYDVDEWVGVETITMDGTDYSPKWPDVCVVGPNQKSNAEIRFEVVFRTKDGELEVYKPDNLYDYKRFVIGDVWKVKVDEVSSIRPLKVVAK